jgi:glutaredoxin-related protein
MDQRPLHDAPSERALAAISRFYPEIIREVASAIARDPVVVVGMAQNPFVRKARKALADAGVPYTYLEYGSYFSQWKPRLAIKMWSGWPTFPQVFVRGRLLGGATETAAALADGTLKANAGA